MASQGLHGRHKKKVGVFAIFEADGRLQVTFPNTTHQPYPPPQASQLTATTPPQSGLTFLTPSHLAGPRA